MMNVKKVKYSKSPFGALKCVTGNQHDNDGDYIYLNISKIKNKMHRQPAWATTSTFQRRHLTGLSLIYQGILVYNIWHISHWTFFCIYQGIFTLLIHPLPCHPHHPHQPLHLIHHHQDHHHLHQDHNHHHQHHHQDHHKDHHHHHPHGYFVAKGVFPAQVTGSTSELVFLSAMPSS